jgi:acyl-CoA synthetase (AMP-forming)/AMP-acid ligase II
MLASLFRGANGRVSPRDFLARRLAAYKLPRTILALAALPRVPHDKIDYQAPRALIADEGYALATSKLGKPSAQLMSP